LIQIYLLLTLFSKNIEVYSLKIGQ
jgi:hypothetical protein